ncbi:uncharacterized protein LOC103524116 [Trichonephila clavipes]|nr:uncharacterized protein LOC103524116 [Trichonephila clavipes]
MAFRAISATPGQNIVIFMDSQAAIENVSGYNLFPSKLDFECKKLINLFLCTGREVVLQWIPSHFGMFMEMNKRTSWSKSLRRCIHLAFRCRNTKRLLRNKFRQKRISILTGLAVGKSCPRLLDGQRRAQIFALPGVEGVACLRVITGHDYLKAHLFKISLAD